MSNIDKQAIREAAEKAITDNHTQDEWFHYLRCSTPATALALLDELEAVQKTSAARLVAIDTTHKMFQRERDRAEKAEKRIAELEAREVKLPELKMLSDYLAEVTMREREDILVGVRLEFFRALEEAGVKVAAAAGKGETS
ncbi:ead/Ea22-like family protein [Escherichia coli]|uniref:ead/Ea22-like family protein n=1 Tax=Escherichia coli TaxID=562 RepID=UPI0020C812AA|nr:ead/Ea22-like family protein [Escherichia coli]EEZ5247446.1 ead/Ea22-like family protein [Escherichia coli]MCP8818997.1 ead/Ea22-like family protein [Escherichia coli]